MSTNVTVGQVWQDKDKRRNTVITILAVKMNSETLAAESAIGLVTGTEEEREYSVERLVKRWNLTKEAPLGEKFGTREEYLVAAVKEITEQVFTPAGIEVPKVRVSVGWPGGRGKKNGVVGQCFASVTSDDKTAQIFLSPAVSETLNVLATLTHELVHAVDDCASGHKAGFIKIAGEIGFEAKWTSSENRTEGLTEKLQEIAKTLGDFPHAAIRQEERPVVQKTYMLKVVSPENPDFFVRMTAGKLEEFGFPRDPWGNEMELEEA